MISAGKWGIYHSCFCLGCRKGYSEIELPEKSPSLDMPVAQNERYIVQRGRWMAQSTTEKCNIGKLAQ